MFAVSLLGVHAGPYTQSATSS